jgi:hypothetical protein
VGEEVHAVIDKNLELDIRKIDFESAACIRLLHHLLARLDLRMLPVMRPHHLWTQNLLS